MKNPTFRLLSGIVTTFIGILLVFAQGTGGYVVVGVGLGYLGSTFFSQDNMAEAIERHLEQSQLLFFRLFEFLSICLIFTEGYATIGLLALFSLISVELFCRKKKQ